VSTDVSAGGNGVALGGTAAYEFYDPDDDVLSVAASGTQGFVRQFSTANIMRQPDLQTGVAVLNYSNTTNTVTFELFDSSARRIGNVSRTLPPYGHLAAFTHQIFGLSLPSSTSITTLKVTASGLIASVVLLFEGELVTAAPVIATSITTPTPSTQQPTITSITPASGTQGSTVNLVIRGSGFSQFTSAPNLVFVPAGGSSTDARFIVSSVTIASATQINATVQIGSSTIPVPAGNYRIELRDSVTLPQVTTQRSDVTGVNMFQVTAGASSTTASREIERLLGTWSFIYTIVTQSTAIYNFVRVEESSTVRGLYQAVDTNYGAIGYYDDQERAFVVLDRTGSLIDSMFVFNFTGTNTISGNYYIFDEGFTNRRGPYPMTGTRTAQPSTGGSGTSGQSSGATSPDVAGVWRVYSARLFYDQGGGGSVTSGGSTLDIRSDGTWSYGSSSGTWSVSAITSEDWQRWSISPYGPSRKLVLSGWNNGTADGPIEETDRVNFLWVLYRVGPPTVSAPGTVHMKFGR
ncbi:MAG: IPT/TIG domain-containing protein, partial [Acidobacteria bacterium]|nr:IPT/TIG domain-containing protein [Acidobacteriota bacterium]